MNSEVLVAYGFIYDRIVNDAVMEDLFEARGLDVTAQVWEYRAPAGVATPYIVYQRQAGGDIKTLGADRIYTLVRTLIRVVDSGEDWGHEDIAARLDVLFGRATNIPVTAPAGYIEFSTRVEPFDQPEDIGGVQYRQLGGIYDIAAQGA